MKSGNYIISMYCNISFLNVVYFYLNFFLPFSLQFYWEIIDRAIATNYFLQNFQL